MVVYYHEAMCHAEKLLHYLQCQGHSKDLYVVKCIFTILALVIVAISVTAEADRRTL